MKKDKKFFLIDFDDVLFDTKKFRDDVIKLFSKFGISREVFYQTYKDFPVKHKDGTLEVYDPEKQFKKIESKAKQQKGKLKQAEQSIETEDVSKYKDNTQTTPKEEEPEAPAEE